MRETITSIERIELVKEGILIELSSMPSTSILLFDEGIHSIYGANKKLCQEFLYWNTITIFHSLVGVDYTNRELLSIRRREEDEYIVDINLAESSAMKRIDTSLYNLADYIIHEEEATSKRSTTGMICYPVSEHTKYGWKCEITLEEPSKSAWFYLMNEMQVIWSILIVFAYKDNVELQIKIDEKTGEILDVFVFSPIEGISM